MADYFEGVAPIQGTGGSAASGGVAASAPGGGAPASAAAAQGVSDAASLSPAALEALQQEQANKELTPEQAALQQRAQELMAKVNQCLANGDTAGAQAAMAELNSLLGTSESLDLGDGSSSGAKDAGNFGSMQGDAPVFSTPNTGYGSYGRSGSVGSTPDLSGVPTGVAGGDNQGVVGTALNIASKGYPYVWGGDGPQEGGYDCSGFTKAVYAKNGISIPRTAQTQYDHCKSQGTLFTDLKNAKAGDLIFFNNPYDKKTSPVGHVMIYLGNGKMVGAQSGGVKVYDYNDYWKKYTVGFGRPK